MMKLMVKHKTYFIVFLAQVTGDAFYSSLELNGNVQIQHSLVCLAQTDLSLWLC